MSTMKDVAKKAGVSVATVSYAINGTKALSPETLAKVRAAIKELKYSPQPLVNSSIRITVTAASWSPVTVNKTFN